LTKAGRFACAVKGKYGGRNRKKGKKKGSKQHYYHSSAEDNDSISDVSAQLDIGQQPGGRTFVPVAALEIVLTEGEPNLMFDEANRHYRIEAERLFNIGLNMGATTNAERIAMVDRLIDLEAKEVENIEDWEEEEVNQ
jgi:hypothetical protein